MYIWNAQLYDNWKPKCATTNADCVDNAIEGNAPFGSLYSGLAMTWIVAQKDSLSVFFAEGVKSLGNQNTECYFTFVIYTKLVHTVII